MRTPKIRNVLQRQGWNIVTTLIGVTGIIFAAYTYYKDDSPKISIEVMGNESVLDVREKLQDLEVFYQGQDIANSGNTLSVVLFKISNSGTRTVTLTDYDDKSPIEVSLTNGRILRANISSASSKYLEGTEFRTKLESGVTFTPFIMESDQWVTIKLLVIHSIGKRPTISAAGKIAGQEKISVLTKTPNHPNESFLLASYAGNLPIQITRLFSYFSLGLVVFIFTFSAGGAISSRLEKRKRKTVVKKFREVSRENVTSSDDATIDLYLDFGVKALKGLIRESEGDSFHDEVVMEMEMRKNIKSPTTDIKTRKIDDENLYLLNHGHFIGFPRVEEFQSSGYFTNIEGRWTVNSERLAVAKELAHFARVLNS